MHRDDEADDPPRLVCTVGSTRLSYDARAIDDAVECNPLGGWYGLRKGYRGRFATYVGPLLEELGLVELEHNPRNNRIRAR